MGTTGTGGGCGFFAQRRFSKHTTCHIIDCVFLSVVSGRFVVKTSRHHGIGLSGPQRRPHTSYNSSGKPSGSAKNVNRLPVYSSMQLLDLDAGRVQVTGSLIDVLNFKRQVSGRTPRGNLAAVAGR